MKKQSVYSTREKHPNNHLGDGVWMGNLKDEFQTFYKYHPPDELVLIMGLSGFKIIKSYPVGNYDVFLFQKLGRNLFSLVISDTLITKVIKSQMVMKNGKYHPIHKATGVINPFPSDYNLENTTTKVLKELEKEISSQVLMNEFNSCIKEFFQNGDLRSRIKKNPVSQGGEYLNRLFQILE